MNTTILVELMVRDDFKVEEERGRNFVVHIFDLNKDASDEDIVKYIEDNYWFFDMKNKWRINDKKVMY